MHIQIFYSLHAVHTLNFFSIVGVLMRDPNANHLFLAKSNQKYEKRVLLLHFP